MGDITVITHHYGDGNVLQFRLLHEKPVGFYVVESSDEDRMITGNYPITQNGDGVQEILGALIKTLSDLPIIVEKMTSSILGSAEEAHMDGSGRTDFVLYSCGMIKNNI